MKPKQAPLFVGQPRMDMNEAIRLSLESLNTYANLHDEWAVAWSGGKDSTAALTFVLWALDTDRIRNPPKRLVVLYADTRMEILPLAHVAQTMIAEMRKLRIDVREVMAPLDKRFLVYMLGRGVPPPNNGTLRWCTRQIKVDPMKAEIARLGSESGKPWLVITGVRIGESAVRDARLVTACSRDGAECGQGHYQSALEGKNATLAPLVHWRVCLVWEWLRSWAPLHDYGGWNTVPLADAYGGDEAEEINARTGCTGCPLASRDTALEAVVAMPRWAYLAPLLELKALWRELREPRHRLRQPGGERRQDGTLCDNQHRMGPLTMAARMMALNRVLDIQHAVNEAARAQNRPPLDMLNHEEHVRILDLIAAGTWPRGWTGREPLATDPFDEAEGEADQRQARLFEDREDDPEGDTLGLEET